MALLMLRLEKAALPLALYIELISGMLGFCD